MRVVVLLAAMALSGCSDQPSEHEMRRMLLQQAAFPGCENAKVRFTGRSLGGGWQGGTIDVRIDGTGPCMEAWRGRLAALTTCQHVGRHFVCHAPDERTGAGIQFQGANTAAVTLWSIT